MTKLERRWCLIYAAVLAILTSLPYFIGFIAQGDSWRFTGFVFGVEDGNSYIAKMMLGARGEWLFRTPYTSVPQGGVIAFLPYILLGKLAAGDELHLQLVVLYHIFRVAVIPLGVLATYRFMALFISVPRWRGWATIIATAGGGVGWLIALSGEASWLGSLPLEFYSPETFGFLAFYGLPHLTLARALLLVGLVEYIRAAEDPGRGWLAGLSFLILSLVQPLAVVSGYAVILAHQVIVGLKQLYQVRWRQYQPWFSAALKTGLISLPLVLYLTYVFTQDPFLRAWTSQNRILSPHPVHYLLAYGLMAIPAFVGAWGVLRRRHPATWLPVGWVLIFPLLAYAPYNLQRRLPEAVWVAIVTLAAVGLSEWRTRPVIQRRVGTAILSVSLFGSLLLLGGGIGVARRPSEPAFRTKEEVSGFLELNKLSDHGEVVLSAYDTGNALPAWAHVRVVVGHGPESANLEVLRPQVEAFYSETMGEDARSDFLRSAGINYVWVGPNEDPQGDWEPSFSKLLNLIYQDGIYQVYEVLVPE
jgi:hypothetical protein